MNFLSRFLFIFVGFLDVNVKMEQRIFIKTAIKDGLKNDEIARILAQHDEQDVFSDLQICYWERQFLLSCEEVNDIRKSGRCPHFLYHI
jgi:hypothetical protein